MHSSFEKWSDTFSDDVESLEESLLSPDKASDLSRLLDQVSDRILARFSDDVYLEKFLHARELRKDNQMLAAQVKHLLKDNKRLELELASRGNQLGSYKQIAGNIYLKID